MTVHSSSPHFEESGDCTIPCAFPRCPLPATKVPPRSGVDHPPGRRNAYLIVSTIPAEDLGAIGFGGVASLGNRCSAGCPNNLDLRILPRLLPTPVKPGKILTEI